MTGTPQSATARTSGSSLKAHRSSMLPPPRPMTGDRKSEGLGRAEHRGQLGGGALALHLGRQHDERPVQPRRVRMRMKSCTAAPVGEVMKPTVRGHQRDGLLALRGEQALGREALLQLFQFLLEPAGAVVGPARAPPVILAAGLVDTDSP